MKQPYEKFMIVELLALGAASLFTFIALIKGYTIVIILGLLLVAGSLIADSLVQWHLYRSIPSHAIKQAVRALLVFIFTLLFLLRL
ncbi:hypothetical protein [Virgibacillus dokdonensis]|uniref:Uncharacterized protein n=1 Tax=Virgibacillus dokdonensis TaxID=302167 RepID=A0A2K9J270_9BACI|nr:hypothetical protein [Virgibacillus dokdonensis]AUJ24101.1 hypothetical protein A21D_00989 [Virgibacillus dokdonensis]